MIGVGFHRDDLSDIENAQRRSHEQVPIKTSLAETRLLVIVLSEGTAHKRGITVL